MTLQISDPVDPRLPWVRTLRDLDTVRATPATGRRERDIARAGRRLHDALCARGKVVSVRTLPTTDAPYPIRFAFNGMVPAPTPGAFLIIKNRSLLVQVRTDDGIKNVLFNPTDGPTNQATPFYRRVIQSTPGFIRKAFEPPPNRCAQQLAELGLSCADIDVIAFDHFHTQDVRPLLGTETLAARFPNAVLLAPRVEWEQWRDPPMIQRAWYVPKGNQGVPESRVVFTDADLSLGEGLLLLRTPGHTLGNQTLFAYAEGGVFGSSENGTCADNWSPRHSRLPGLKRGAALLDLDVVLNSNTPELAAAQYASMLLERAIVDSVPDRPEFVQMFPSSEVAHSVIAPHIRPTHRFGKLESGQVVPSAELGRRAAHGRAA